MNTKLYFIICFSIIASTFSSCCKCFTPPEGITFNIISSKDSSDLVYNEEINLDSISIFYIEDHVKKYIEIDTYVDTTSQRVLIQSNDISWKSSEGHKTFFLYLNQNDINTIYLDIEKVKDGCCTFFNQNEFKINNIVLTKNEDWVYKFIK
jgi:hypothetical protein